MLPSKTKGSAGFSKPVTEMAAENGTMKLPRRASDSECPKNLPCEEALLRWLEVTQSHHSIEHMRFPIQL